MYLNSVGNFQLSPIFSPIFKFCRRSLNDYWKRQGTLLVPIQFLLQGIPLSPSLLIDLSKLTCKDYYWFFLSRKEPCTTGPSKWQPNLPQFTLSWSTIFKWIKSISKQNKLKEFFYNLTHHIVTTKKELHLYRIEDKKSCHYCGDDDSLLHSFLGCHIAVDFLQKVLCWFNEKENSSITSNSKEILFGTATDNDNK